MVSPVGPPHGRAIALVYVQPAPYGCPCPGSPPSAGRPHALLHDLQLRRARASFTEITARPSPAAPTAPSPTPSMSPPTSTLGHQGRQHHDPKDGRAGGKTTTVVNHYEGNQLENVTTTVTENGGQRAVPDRPLRLRRPRQPRLSPPTRTVRPALSPTTRRPPPRSWPTTPTTRFSIALAAYRSYASGAKQDSATYTYDALDRVTKEHEFHHGLLGTRRPGCPTLGLTGPRARRPSRLASEVTKTLPTTPRACALR